MEEIDKKLKSMSEYDYEIIMVNDCSPDGTFEVLKELCAFDKRRKAINFAKNFGQHAALMAGIRLSDGDYVVCLDDDGQTPPNEVDKLINKLHEGFDAVYAKYATKKHSAFRNFGSKVNEKMARVMLGKPKELYVSSYFAVRRFIANDMIRYENSYPYVIGLVLRATKNIANVEVNHQDRLVGTSGYTLKKLFGLWMNGFTAFSIKPLRISTFIGALCAGAGFIYGIYTIIKRLVVAEAAQYIGFAALMSAVIFFGGMILLMLGLLGEYIGRVYISLNSSPQYVIKEVINSDSDK